MMAEPPLGWASDWEDETGKYVYNESTMQHSRYVNGEFSGTYDAGQIELETAVVSAKESILSSIQNYVTENKDMLLAEAKTLQKTGEIASAGGLAMAAVGAPIAGVGSAPGLTVAAAGGAASLTGSLMELAVEIIADSPSNPDSPDPAESIITDILINKTVDYIIPGPTPNVITTVPTSTHNTAPIVNEALKQGASKILN